MRKALENGFDTVLRKIDIFIAEALLDAAHITANKNTVPKETRSPFVTSGIRLGTAAATTRGLGPEDFQLLASCIARIIREGEAGIPAARKTVAAITERYPLYA